MKPYSGDTISCPFDIYGNGSEEIRERKKALEGPMHKGFSYELGTPDGISFGYYNVFSKESGKVQVENRHPFFQISYVVRGSKTYATGSNNTLLASMVQQQYNYLFLPQEAFQLNWPSNEQVELFELGMSPEVFSHMLPENHPLYEGYMGSMKNMIPASISQTNLPLLPRFSAILYDMLNCPLENRYKQLYVRSKATELLLFQLEQYENFSETASSQTKELKKEEVERMYLAREIILGNLNSPCSLIDLAHQVGTNEAYLKSHFKKIFGTTVFGFVHQLKMEQARELLLNGKNVSEVAYITGYKYIPNFTKAFKKYFGVAPTRLKG